LTKANNESAVCIRRLCEDHYFLSLLGDTMQRALHFSMVIW